MNVYQVRALVIVGKDESGNELLQLRYYKTIEEFETSQENQEGRIKEVKFGEFDA